VVISSAYVPLDNIMRMGRMVERNLRLLARRLPIHQTIVHHIPKLVIFIATATRTKYSLNKIINVILLAGNCCW
jgi:hypothetical protein